MSDHGGLDPANLDRWIQREDVDASDDDEVDDGTQRGPCIVQMHRAFGASTVTFGPFDTVADALDWCNDRELRGMIVLMFDPAADTGPFAEVWR